MSGRIFFVVYSSLLLLASNAFSLSFQCKSIERRPSKTHHRFTAEVKTWTELTNVKTCFYWPVEAPDCKPEGIKDDESFVSEGLVHDARQREEYATFRHDHEKHGNFATYLFDFKRIEDQKFVGYIKHTNLAGDHYLHLNCEFDK